MDDTWRNDQRRIGLTGGIASGKTSAARWLVKQGLPVLDADDESRAALAPGSEGARRALARYGSQVLADGTRPEDAVLDRAALAQIVFADPQERRWLERLVHPVVRARFETTLARLADAPMVVLMVPLLFEAALDNLCSEVWLVDCDENQQLQRLMKRDDLSEADARRRITAQWSLGRKRALADLLIDNRGGPQELERELRRALAREGPHISQCGEDTDETTS